ncbi:MAG: hypothetical protein ACRDZR_13740, partial [Acidimicrobiales bacterium]
PGARRAPWAAVASVGIYAVLGLVAYRPSWPGGGGRIVGCPCGDGSESAWFLAWTPHAVLHGLDPFFTTAVNHPVGVNLAANATMPLLGLLALPVTLTAGPAASLSLLLWAAYPLSAGAMYLVLRRWTAWAPAAFAGGLLYGFSPYMVGQGRLHLNLVFVPLPPLVMLALYELVVRRRGGALRWGGLLGALVAAQYLVSTEILATTVVVALLGLVVLAAARPREVLPALRHAAPGAGLAAGIAAVVVAYPTWELLAGPRRYHLPLAFVDQVSLRGDLLGAVVPTRSAWLSPGWLAHLGGAAAGSAGVVENGTYLGVPLLLLAGYLAVRFRRDRWLPYLLAMAACTYVLSLGPHLTVGGHRTGVPLPFALVERVPLLELATPVRLSLYTAMFVAVLVALGLDHLRRAVAAPSRTRPGRAELVVVGVVAVAALLALVPRWPAATSPSGVPPYFTAAGVDRVPPGATVLAYPYPVPGRSQAMLWQAAAGMRFAMLGSYALHPVAGGLASQYPTQLRPADVQPALYALEGAGPPPSPPVPRPRLVADLRELLADQHVAAVLVGRRSPGAGAAASLVASALGEPPARKGGVDAWYGVQDRLARTR